MADDTAPFAHLHRPAGSRGVLALCTPMYDGRCHEDHARSVSRGVRVLEYAGWKVVRPTMSGCPILPRARNACVAEALAMDAQQIVFIDSDVGFPTNVLLALCEEAHLDVIVGAAPQRRNTRWNSPPGVAYRSIWGVEADLQFMKENPQALVPVLAVPTGFMRIPRKVVDGIVAEGLVDPYVLLELPPTLWEHLFMFFDYGDRRVDWDQPEAQVAARRAREVLGEEKANRLMHLATTDEGEDYRFCDKARAAGFEVYLNPYLRVRHYEGRTVHDFCLADALVREEKDPPE